MSFIEYRSSAVFGNSATAKNSSPKTSIKGFLVSIFVIFLKIFIVNLETILK